MKLINRPVTTADIEEICAMPQNPYELYHMFPKANFPLTSSQLNEAIAQRNNSTVFLIEDNLVAFANFYAVVPQEYCSIGNVIVHPKYRQKGIGEQVIRYMESIAKTQYAVKTIHLSCFCDNIAGLLFYKKLGYFPYDLEPRENKKHQLTMLIKMQKIV